MTNQLKKLSSWDLIWIEDKIFWIHPCSSCGRRIVEPRKEPSC